MIRSLTIERQSTPPPGSYYDFTRRIPAGVLVLASARVDIELPTPTVYSSIPKSISLELGSVTSSSTVIDNDPDNFYFKVVLEMNIIDIGGTKYLSSTTYPGTSFTMSAPIESNTVFRIKDQTGADLYPAYFSFHFNAIER